MWEKVTINQILLVTDGCSNIGGDPVQAAETARKAGITVNVIGIIDAGALGTGGEREATEIASAGGGVCRIVEAKQLAQTMQMMTRHTMQLTIQQAVNRELKTMIGRELEDIHPFKRVEIASMIDQAGEKAKLRLILLVDVSASMKDKLPQVREAIRDLEIGLDARMGEHQIAVMTYPAPGNPARVLSHFTEKPGLAAIGSELSASGGTPTGPALEQAISLLLGEKGMQDGRARSYVV
ncbi:vWA domain-containing protein [Effusibacillus lacus]|uniref:VWFA domain-containing protein n=1 Tax=Effusibacillus lacus TaxID=1348429 RepID=A0A292YIF7_9BACL|nr:VWA domain-containing protein [Effusibacillus lacus]TCS74480.1 Ca-activated chloride channel family protein [Effusibacillus lacus]GAX88649.1 hypothetical protein EFBL_0261 [Effusibacillus lacus]